MPRTHYQKDSHLWKRPWTPVSKLAFCFVVVLIVCPAQAEVLGASFAGDKECFMGAG